MRDFHPETLRKIKMGMLILCGCGTAHTGKYPKCANCMKRTCQQCGTRYIKGTERLCSACNKRRLARAESGLS